ncbi:RNA polymerase sigma factor [Thalassoglobus polymorphus]|uniref:RNA polymerase sigma factor n=1 Tax=Thalassoglobus polymorphus TaxID=2527994 RepID=UPI0018D24046|nr:RNA polymerase sigma factor [Thalassoglobus polymorphus]
METDESKQLDPARLTKWHDEYFSQLSAFLFGLLRNHALVEETVQTTFTKALLSGGNVQPGSEKAWLFQVGYHEAMAIRRKAGIHKRAVSRVENQLRATENSGRHSSPGENLLQWETANKVREALSELPDNLQQIVSLRIYEEKTFQQIADELKLPLGTVLTRMRSALQKLQVVLKRDLGQ